MSPLRMDDAYCPECLSKMKKDWCPENGKGYVRYTCKPCGYFKVSSPLYVTTSASGSVSAKERD